MSTNQKLLDWLDDLCVRFIVNLPHEELQSVERICFQIEEAQWFYEDFIRPLDPTLPSMNLRVFSQRMFQHCPLFAGFTATHREGAYEQFLQYKTRVPVRGAIMLNQDMTHAVLVKGWKKGAKWSFPRGKINKDELDLDCAVREVYEETGLDLHEAGLVQPEEQMKSIDVNMREQSLKLYVFRGVPMDTNFEPRTRKEISKIDWYKLSDLPTLRRKNHPQGNGHDVKDNSFYMVTPFIPQLKSWIKTQRQLEKRSKPAGAAHLPPPAVAGITDTELEGDLGDTTADEAAIPEFDPDGANFAQLVANLGRSHRASDALPEVQQLEPSAVDPAAELKRLLSVGGGFLQSGQMLETPPVDNTMGPPSNPLLGMFQRNNKSQSHTMPTTPFDQMLPTPQMPQSPHGQHHPRQQPHFEHMPPPPHFPFHPQQGHSFQSPHHQPPMPSQHNNGFPPNLPPQFFPPLQHQQNFPPHPPNVQQTFMESTPRHFVQNEGPPFTPQQQGFQNQRGPVVPPASKLPPPKLTTHALNLLNSFKLSEKSAAVSPQSPRETIQATPRMTQPPAMHRGPDSFMSSPGMHSANPYAPSPPAFQSPPLVDSIQPAQPRPRNAHQTSLLSLFRSPSITAATPELPKSTEEPAELSALPTTPGLARVKSGSNAVPPMPNMNAKPILNAAPQQPNKPGNTSATIRGPVNAPDFDTVKKNSHQGSNRTSRGPSPANPKMEQKAFVPQQILRREGTPKNLAPRSEGSARTSPRVATTTTPNAAFNPRILKRPQQPSEGVAVAAAPAVAAAVQPVQAPSPKPEPGAQVPDLLSLFKTHMPPNPAAAKSPISHPAQPFGSSASPSASGSNPHTQELLGLFKSPSPAAQQMPNQTTAPSQKSKSIASSIHSPPPFEKNITVVDSARHAPPMDQKSTLLSLFNSSNPSPKPSASRLAHNPVEHSQQQQQQQPQLTQSPVPILAAKTAFPGVAQSPVSPLPAGSSMDTPAHLRSRSRISSIGEGSFGPGVGVGFGIGVGVAPPTSHPILSSATAGGMDAGPGATTAAAVQPSGAPAAGGDQNKSFLLGFLNDFANKGR